LGQQKRQQTAHLERTAAGIVTLSKLSGTTTDSWGSTAAADHERVSGQRGAKRSERFHGIPWNARTEPPQHATRPRAVTEVALRAPTSSLGAGHAQVFLFALTPGIREPDCETYMSSRSEVLVIWRWCVDEHQIGKRYSGDSRLILPKSSHGIVDEQQRRDSLALRNGAAGYLMKGSRPTELLAAIRKVAAGGKYVSPAVAELLATDVESARVKLAHESLSDQEFKVLRLLAVGTSLSGTARELGLSPSTVGTYRSRIMDKLDLKNNADLVRYALKNNLRD
jgi:DNA-binding CsgD family transcriptional regulator